MSETLVPGTRRNQPVSMRSFVAVIVLAALGLTSLRAADVEFVRVWPGWRDADSFESISEYFTGREDTGRQTVLRTHPDARAGFYYLVRVMNHSAAQSGTKFSLQLIAPDSPNTKTFTFPVDLRAGKSVFQLGLTGPAWPNKDAHPVAWKLELLATDGQVLATAKSFLWEKPAQ